MPDPELGSDVTKTMPGDELRKDINTDGPTRPPSPEANEAAGIESVLSDLEVPETVEEDSGASSSDESVDDSEGQDQKDPLAGEQDSFLTKVEREAAGESRRIRPDLAVASGEHEESENIEDQDNEEDSRLEGILRRLT